ncbi:MAG: flagellar motor stator protein MotA [Deltaproteobacteria bacterium]|nr:flagellar motor stator protein MotA [Deltaproteobacteria bacterium]
MLSIVGYLVVFGAVLGGFIEAGGPVAILLQLAEFMIIGGAAVGAVIASAPAKVLSPFVRSVGKALTGTGYTKAQYMELFHLLFEVFSTMRRKGEMALEKDVDDPLNSPVFSKYSHFLRNEIARSLLCDTLRLVISGSANPEELAQLMDEDIATREEEDQRPISLLTKVADALPGLGIVAAVLGVIVAMGSIDQGSQVLGQKIAAALVGTFLGVLLCYGIFQPLAIKMEFLAREEKKFLECIKTGILAHIHGGAPIISVEHARRVVFSGERPSALELEEACRALKAQSPVT